MVDRLFADAIVDDAELPLRTAEPLLSNLRDQLSTASTRGERTITPSGAKYSHRIDAVSVQKDSASITDCTVDDQQVVGPDGSVVDGALTSKQYAGTLLLDGTTWKVQNVEVLENTEGLSGCAA
jgi:hypothetical protein